MFGNAVDAVSVAVQRRHEGLGEYPIQLGGIQGSGVFPRDLKRVQSRVIIPGNCREERTNSAKHAHHPALRQNLTRKQLVNKCLGEGDVYLSTL